MTDKIQEVAGTPSTAPKSASEIAEEHLGNIDWITPNEGYCDCPGRERHSSKDGRRDCILYLDKVPTLYCVHASCGPAIEEANRKLRAAILSGTSDGSKPRKLTVEDRAKLKQREDRERIRRRAAKSLPQILANHQWTYDQIVADSPVQLQGNERDHWRLLLQKFDAADTIWIGDTYDSGKPEHAKHFKSAAEWLKGSKAPGPFICPAAFKNTSIARSNDNILARRFLVVESDTLKKDEVGAVFRWLRDKVGLELIAIVDTAGKSLHGWFKYPTQDFVVDDLKLVLPALQCDPKLFTPSQPVRLPGALRNGKFQKLVYLAQDGLAKEVAHD